jgi:hypothetical protein
MFCGLMSRCTTPQHLIAGQAFALHVLRERLPVAQVLHGVVRETTRRSGAEHLHDVGMLEVRQRAGFGEEAIDGPCGCQLRPDDLDGYEAVERGFAGDEHRPHAAARDLAQQFVPLWAEGALEPFEVGRHRVAVRRKAEGVSTTLLHDPSNRQVARA